MLLLAAVIHSWNMSAQVLYALTAGVAGYVSAVQYKTMGGTNWVRTAPRASSCKDMCYRTYTYATTELCYHGLQRQLGHGHKVHGGAGSKTSSKKL